MVFVTAQMKRVVVLNMYIYFFLLYNSVYTHFYLILRKVTIMNNLFDLNIKKVLENWLCVYKNIYLCYYTDVIIIDYSYILTFYYVYLFDLLTVDLRKENSFVWVLFLYCVFKRSYTFCVTSFFMSAKYVCKCRQSMQTLLLQV